MTITQSLRRSLTMKIKVKICIILVLLLIQCNSSFCQLGGLSGKLNFEEPATTTSHKQIVETIVSVRQSSPQTRKLIDSTEKLFNIKKISEAAEEAAERIKNEFESLSLICTNGVCNTTELTKKDNLKINDEDSKVDVIVKVVPKGSSAKENKTKIDIKGSDGDVDVPIIVGTDSKSVENRINGNRNFVPYAINRNLNNNYRPKYPETRYPIPHFNPNLNNHYFGENPPPMYVWHKHKINYHNPQAFVSHGTSYYPSTNWRRSTSLSNEKKNTKPVICTCVHQPSSWYPIIDDKMEHV